MDFQDLYTIRPGRINPQRVIPEEIYRGVRAFNNKKRLIDQTETGKQRLQSAWGVLPNRLNATEGGSFGYRPQPSYSDTRGNVYDAVSGRLLYPGRTSAPLAVPTERSVVGTTLSATQGPAERAYQQEVSRVAQLTAQDPELQRYETARQAAVAPGATPEQVQSAEDIGMKIWAQKYGNLAQKVKPGQAGYDVIQQTINPPAPGAPTWLSGFGANPYNISSSASFQAPAAVGIDAAQVPAAAALTPSMASTPALAITPPSQEVLDETQRKLLLQAFR